MKTGNLEKKNKHEKYDNNNLVYQHSYFQIFEIRGSGLDVALQSSFNLMRYKKLTIYEYILDQSNQNLELI